ncbi:MAG: VTT domain-containing protein, partial [Planctomycetota bacterium]|nr:VTT domain-containing protein [Planctomycetota bacterium]
MSLGSVVKKLGPTSVLAVMALVLPPLGGFLVIGFMDTIATWLESHRAAGPWIYAGAFAVLAGLALLPTYAQAILGGWAFGLAVGYPAALAGFTGAALLGYAVARPTAGERVTKLIDEQPKWAAVRDALLPEASHGRSHGFWRTLGIVTLLRLPPNSPFAITNLLLASVRVPLHIYIIGTVLGMAPRTFVAVWLGATLHQQFTSIREGLDAKKPWWLLAAGFVVTLLVLGVIGAIAN